MLSKTSIIALTNPVTGELFHVTSAVDIYKYMDKLLVKSREFTLEDIDTLDIYDCIRRMHVLDGLKKELLPIVDILEVLPEGSTREYQKDRYYYWFSILLTDKYIHAGTHKNKRSKSDE